MPIITSIKPQKRKADQFNIFLDGKFAFSLPAVALAKESLRENQEISQDQMNALIKEGEFSSIFDKVLKFLSFRPRSEFEVKQYLVRKGVGEETIKFVLEKLKKLKFLDDRAFTKWWIEQRSAVKPEGGRLVKMELKIKGIPSELIDEFLSEQRSAENEAVLAEKLALKKWEKIKDLPACEVKRKLFLTLSQRGFSFEVIGETVDKLLKKE